MRPVEIVKSKKEHIARLTNRSGAEGESQVLASQENWQERPKGQELRNLLGALENTGISIKPTCFDAIALPIGKNLDLSSVETAAEFLSEIVFIEIKSANQSRVKPDFTGFFFALTENEILAAELLGNRHRVALHNKISGEIVMSSVSEILDRAKSKNWQVSVQL